MKRRNFLKIAGSSLVLSSWYEQSAVAAEGDVYGPGIFGDCSKFNIGSLFESNREDALELTEDVFCKCILDKVVAPVPPLEHNWVYPGGPYYKGQWIWDTMFVVDLLSILPGTKKVIRDIFRNYWDFQDRWNAVMPDYAKDMITVAIKTEPQEVRQFSQIPILAWGLERVYLRNGDRQLLEQCLERLERFHEWYWRERDFNGIGLVTVGSYSGKLQHARWETFDYECNMDDLKLTVHPKRKDADQGKWYGDIYVTANTSYLIMAERSLARLAEIAGDSQMATRRKRKIDKAVKAMRDHMWDEKTGAFLSVKRDSMEKIPVVTIGSWIPLTAGVPTNQMAKRMARVLAGESWQTPLPVPTVDSTDKRWRSRGFWRGDVWPSTNYQIARGLADYGHTKLAADIADKTVANAIKNGINEHYDSVSGKGIGIKDYCMSCTLLTMMLEGLTQKYKVKLSSESS